MSIKTKITKEDVDEATAEYQSRDVTCCCVVFQVAKRLGLNPVACGYWNILTQSQGEIAFEPERVEGRIVTAVHRDEWPQFIGSEIEFPTLDSNVTA